MTRVLILVALVLVGCGRTSHAGCFVYSDLKAGGPNDQLIVIVDKPSDALPDWYLETGFTTEQCERLRPYVGNGILKSDLAEALR